jgi:hypothetical protein
VQLERRLELLEIEADRRVGVARIGGGHGLEPLVVRGHHRGDAARGQRLEHRLRQRRALLGIGADRDLVDQHQHAGAAVGEQLAQPRDVAGERRQVGLEALGVADVRAHRGEPADRRAALGRQVQPASRHQRAQPGGLERDGLAAGVGPRDHQAAAGGDGDVVGDAAPPGQQHQRVAGVEQRHPRRKVELGRGGDQVLGQPAGGDDHVERAGRGHRGVEAVGLLGDPPRQPREDPPLLVGDLALGQLLAVVEIDDLLGLDEDRLAAVRGAVDDALDEALAVGAHRQHVALLALRVVVVLEQRRVARVVDQLLHAAVELRGQRDHALAQRAERRAGVIDQLAVGVERLEDRVEDVAEVGDAGGDRGQRRRHVVVLAQVRAHPGQGLARAAHRHQLAGVERRGLAHPGDGRPDLLDAAQRHRRVDRRQVPRLADRRDARLRRLDRRQPGLGADRRRAARRRRARRPVLDEPRPPEVGRRLWIQTLHDGAY